MKSKVSVAIFALTLSACASGKMDYANNDSPARGIATSDESAKPVEYYQPRGSQAMPMTGTMRCEYEGGRNKSDYINAKDIHLTVEYSGPNTTQTPAITAPFTSAGRTIGEADVRRCPAIRIQGNKTVLFPELVKIDYSTADTQCHYSAVPFYIRCKITEIAAAR